MPCLCFTLTFVIVIINQPFKSNDHENDKGRIEERRL